MSSTLQVDTAYGPIVGFVDTFPLRDASAAEEIVRNGAGGGKTGVQKWLGVPFAQADRWTRPKAPAAWTEPKECFEFGSMFPQPEGSSEKIFQHQPGVFQRKFVKQSEDSHNLNVFAPSSAKAGDKLPVMCFIYGGSLNNGSTDRWWYDPTEWIRAQEAAGQPVIVVSGSYRTNIFGFFSGPDVLAADPDGLSGNYGLYDCVSMLEWVQSNIARFGGDASNVTLFGQSAGAFLVANLLVTGKKLFRRAIHHSGAAGTMGIRPVEEAYPSYSQVLNFHGPSAATAEARINALRTVPAEQLLKTHNECHRFGGVNLTIETGPNATWTEATLERLRKGEWDPWIESVILGTTEDEGTMFTLGMRLNSPAGFEGYIKNFPAPLQAAVRKRYLNDAPHPEEVSLIDAPASKLLADQIFVDPVFVQAVAMSSRPHANGDKCRVWVYRVREVIDRLSKTEVAECGAMHCIELPLVFNTASLWDWNDEAHEAKSAKVMGAIWARYATGGNPDPNWQPFTPDSPTWYVFGTGGDVENESLADYARDRIEFGARRVTKEEGDETLGETNE